jgi:hypothetical protein
VITFRRGAGRTASNPDTGTAGPPAARTKEPLPAHHATASSRTGLYLTAVAALAAVGAAVVAVRHIDIAAGFLLLVSMIFCGLVVRGPRPAGRPPATAVSGLLFCLVTTVSAMAAITGYQQISNPDQLLLLAVFSLCALAVVFMVVASWLPRWRYREPAVLALLTLAWADCRCMASVWSVLC